MKSIVHSRVILFVALALVGLARGGRAVAQGTPAATPKPPLIAPSPPRPIGPPAPLEILEAKPEVYYLPDEKGKPIQVLNFPYEEFRRLYDLDQKLAQSTAPPTHVVQSVVASGVADKEFAEFDVRVRWVIRSQAWTRIPLRLGGAVLRDMPTYDGAGEHFVEAERGGGLAVWVRERDATPHTLALRVRVPLRGQGDEQQLSLPFPAATLSELELKIPRPQLAAVLSGGGSLLANETRPGGATYLKIAGLGENFQLGWRPREANALRLIGAVEATSTIAVRIDGPRRVSSDARIRLRGIAAGVEAFRVRLPAGMEFIPALEPGYSAAVVEALPASATSRAAQVVEVRLEQRGVAFAEIRLRAASPEPVSGQPDEPLETLGFEVLGVVRQSGVAEFMVNGDWSIQYGERVSVQPAELPDAARQQGIVSRFEFQRQPCSLLIQVQPKKSRVQVDPSYVLSIGATQARLQATLNYRLSGAVTTRLQIDCGDWVIDRVEPERIGMHATTSKDQPGLLTISWPVEAPPLRDFELQLYGHRDLTPEQPLLALAIPRPVLESPLSAAVVIAPEDNIAVTPRTAELVGLVAEPLPPASTLPGRLQSPLYYRARLDAEPKRFVADVRRRPRTMVVTARHALRIEDAGLRADHRLRYTVANEPVDRCHVVLGATADAPLKIQFFLESGPEQLTPLSAKEVDAGGEVEGMVWELTLPEPRIGQFTLLARLHWSPLSGPLGTTHERPVPLLMPVAAGETSVVHNWLRLGAEHPWRAEVARQDWSALDGGEMASEGGDEPRGASWYAGPETANDVVLRWGRGTAGRGAFWVHKAWIQTCLSRQHRRDRCVWRITPQEAHVTVQLPVTARTEDLVVAVDGGEVAAELDAARALRIPLPVDSREHVVEVTCFLSRPELRQGLRHLELPRLVGGNSAPRFLWQLITPRDQHLVSVSGALNPETRWGWRSGYWERQASWGQAELERWTGAAPQAELPQETNQYLFSAIGAVDLLDVWLMPRAVLVFAASAAALLAGLLFLYVRLLRHPLTFAIAGLTALASAVTWPEAAALVAQAALLGWALALVARMLRGNVDRRGRPLVTRVSRSSVRRTIVSEPGHVDPAPPPVPATTAAGVPQLPSTAAPKA